MKLIDSKDNKFVDQNPRTLEPGTPIPADVMNAIQFELANTITGYGLTLDANNNLQLKTALESHFAPLASPAFTGTPTAPDVSSNGNGQQIVNLESMKAYVAAGQLGFTPVQQGGGVNMSSNHVYIGWSGSELVAQVDQTSLGGFVFQQEDNNTYGIRKFGFNHVAGTPSAQDSKGTWHYLAEQNWVQGQYLPLTGGEITGSLTVDQTAIIGGISIQKDSSTGSHVIARNGDQYFHSISLDNDIYRSNGTTWTLGNSNVMTFSDYTGSFIFRDSNKVGDQASRVLALSASNSTVYSPLTVTGSLTANDLTTNGKATINKGLSVGSASGGTMGVEIGDTTSNSNNTTYIDLHSFGAANDYDVRLSSYGGQSGTSGEGAFSIQAASTTINNSLNVNGNTTLSKLQVNGSINTSGAINISGGSIGKGGNNRIAFEAGGHISIWNSANQLIWWFANDDPNQNTVNSNVPLLVNSYIKSNNPSSGENSNVVATTSFVQNNFVNNSTWNGYMNQAVKTDSTPTFQGTFLKTLAFNNGGNSSVYQDANTGNIVLHTNNGSDHYSTVNSDGSMNLAGGLTTGGQATINGAAVVNGDVRVGQGNWLYTNTIGSYNGTVAFNAGVLVNGNLNIGGEAWYQTHDQGDYGTHIATTAFVHNVANQKGSDIQGWANGQFVSIGAYSGDFNSQDSRIIFLAYGKMIQFEQLGVMNNHSRVNFPRSFSSAPVVIVSPSDDGDTNGHAYGVDNSGFYIHKNGGGTIQFNYTAFGSR